MSRVLTGLLAVVLTIIQANCIAHAQKMQSPVTIGMVVDGPWEHNAEVIDLTKHEILTLTSAEFDVRFPEEKLLISDWTLESIRMNLQHLLADNDVDVVLAMGVLASAEASRMNELPKPVICPFVIDAEIQDLPSSNGGTGVKNLNYLSIPNQVARDIQIFKDIVKFDKVTILLNETVRENVPVVTSRIEKALRELDVSFELILVKRDIQTTLDQLTDSTEAVYVAPLLHLLPGGFERLVQDLIDKKIPSFSLFGATEVEMGILAGANPPIIPKITRRIALNLQRILLGEEAATIPTAFTLGEQVIINMATARRIGVSPPFTVMTEAVLLNDQTKTIDRTVNLAGVMQEAVDKNLDLAAERRFVQASEQNIGLARSQLLPQVDLDMTGLLIDKDRAAASFGSQPQRALLGSVSGSQLLYSEEAWANYRIQKELYLSQVEQLEQLRLDIVQDAATAYLNILRAKTFEKIQKENLKRTRSNLELARVRESIGFSGRSEVYRWEREIADSRREVINSIAQRNLAEIALNQLLRHPSEEPFLTDDATITDPAVSISNADILGYFDDPMSFDTFRNFMVQQTLAQAPELRAIDAAIAAQERELKLRNRAFWLPSLAIQGEVSHRLAKGGAGSDPFDPGAGLPPDLTFQPTDDTNWSLALSLIYPISLGGARIAGKEQAGQQLQSLYLDRQSIAQQIEQRIRSSLHVAGASRAGIGLSRASADAAAQNLNYVTDAYSQGAVDIIALLDAQNAALNSDLTAANAVYNFLIDIMEVERANGGFWYFATAEQRTNWFNALRDYFEKAGVSPRGR